MSDISIDVLRGSPTEEELAAVIAVLSETYSTEAASAVVDDTPGPSGWMLSARGLRQPLRRELGWGHFAG